VVQETLVGRAGAAHLLGVSESMCRNYERAGQLKAAMAVGGRRLFFISDVRALRRKLDARRRPSCTDQPTAP
jgi:DNA-binding transcriptional MerR regulator